MAKMSDVEPVTEYQLVQLASVALAVGRADWVPLHIALEWLARQVDDRQLSARLFSFPTSPGERVVEFSTAGDSTQWRLILKKAAARQVDADRMPSIAQSRYIHVDDLAQLAASPDTSEACRTALLALVTTQRPAPRPSAVIMQSAEREPATTAPAPAANTVQAVVPNVHKYKRRAEPLAAVLAEAKRRALDPSDWTSLWAALVELAESANRPAPLLGYVEGEGVQYRTDDAEQPAGYLSREAFRGRYRRNG